MAHKAEALSYFISAPGSSSTPGDSEQVIARTPLSPQFDPESLVHHPTSGISTPSGGAVHRSSPGDIYPNSLPSVRPRPTLGSIAASGAPAFPPAASMYGPGSAVQSSPQYFQAGMAGIGWHLPSHDSSRATSGQPSINPLGYQYNQPQTLPVGDLPFGDFVSPTSISTVSSSLDFGFPWEEIDAKAASHAASSQPQALSTSLPRAFTTREGSYSDTSRSLKRGFADVGGEEQAFHTPDHNEEDRYEDEKAQTTTQTTTTASHNASRASVSSQATASSGASSSMSKPNPVSKLRSASRTSKNTVHRPSETLRERKSRNSHNDVEREYRNRLNSSFQTLLNVLPDSISGQEVDGSPGTSPDLSEKRVTKQDVLVLAGRYIKSLEMERDAVARERDELRDSLEKLKR